MVSNLQHVQGLDGLLDALKALPPEIASKNGGPARAALAKGAKIIRDQFKENMPVDPKPDGLHARDYVAMLRDRDPGQLGVNERYSVGVRLKSRHSKRGKGLSVKYWRHVEFGTELQPAQSPLRRAFETRKQDAMATIVDTLTKGIERAAKKVARGR